MSRGTYLLGVGVALTLAFVEGDARGLRHGRFVIDRDGRVHSAHSGHEPFTGNRTLLYELARLEGRRPAARSE
jgi:hypothetical protein